jgi:hypothetical protein
MGHDRTLPLQIGAFQLAIDRDHKGFYRGHQAMQPGQYRGWHYHIEHPTLSQQEVMQLLEEYLMKIGAKRMPWNGEQLGIGNVEHHPAALSSWRLREVIYNKNTGKFERGQAKTCVLWLSGFNGKLHIETDKSNEYAIGILAKKDLIRILRAQVRES